MAVAFSPDDKHLVTGGALNAARVWSLTAKGPIQAQVLTGHNGTVEGERGDVEGERGEVVMSVAFSDDGRWLATGGSGVLLWDLKADKPFERPAQRFAISGLVRTLRFDPTSRFLAGATESITLWDLSRPPDEGNAVSLRPAMVSPERAANDFRFSRDGRWLVTVSQTDLADEAEVALWPLMVKDLLRVATDRVR